MFKKLLVAVLAITFVIGMFSPAIATKNPNEAKKLWQSLPPGTMRDLISQNAIDDRPVQQPYTGNAHKTAAPNGAYHKETGPCTDYLYNGAAYYYVYGSDFGAAVRFTPAGTCTLKTISVLFDPTTVGSAGVDYYVWQDDGFGFPGAVTFTVFVPHASIQYEPNMTTVDISSGNVIASADYHAGFVPVNSTDDYRPKGDDGTTGAGRSTLKNGIAGSWMTNSAAFGIDINWVIIVNACCGTGSAGGCEAHIYDNGVYYRWGGKDPKAVRFTATNECTLMTASVGLSSGGQVGTGGIDVTVYADAGGVPGSVVGVKHVAHGALIIPGMSVVNMQSLGLVFNNVDYHVGYSITNPVTDDYQLRSDDGTGGNGRSTIYDSSIPGWVTNAAAFAPDEYNWLIQDSTCCSTAPPICWTESYAGTPVYYWPLPDIYGDDFFNMRFTNATKCTLKTVNLAFYAAGSVGSPGATIYLWHSDGTFPTTVITSFPVPTVSSWYPAYTSVNVTPAQIFSGEYHVGYSPILYNPGEKLAILSDNGSTATGRGSEYYLDSGSTP